MYKAPEQFPIPDEVNDFNTYRDSLGIICDLDNWYITCEMAECFKLHMKQLLKLAENGEPWSQYFLGNMYLLGYIYSSAEDFHANYEQDIAQGSFWLEKSARQGFVSAVDNLITSGTGEEAERLRSICKKVEEKHPEFIQYPDGDSGMPVILPSLCETVWQIAYGDSE